MKFLLLTTALIFAGKAQSDNFWICGSDDDPRSVIVTLPEKGAARVQVGGEGNKLATFEEQVDEDGDRSLRFNFNNYDSSVIIFTSLKKKKRLKKGETNVVRGGLYDFSSAEKGEMVSAIQLVCLPRVDK
jgi:hypothetical protein